MVYVWSLDEGGHTRHKPNRGLIRMDSFFILLEFARHSETDQKQ